MSTLLLFFVFFFFSPPLSLSITLWQVESAKDREHREMTEGKQRAAIEEDRLHHMEELANVQVNQVSRIVFGM